MNSYRMSWFHILAWGAMVIYFLVAPDLFTLVFVEHGKPLSTNDALPAESDQIKFVIDGLIPYVKDGDNLFSMYGWALFVPESSMPTNVLTREIVLVSEERRYSFSTQFEYRNPDLESRFKNAEIDLRHLGFRLFIAEDVIKPGKYRVGIVFRNDSTETAFYCDKPVYYLVKTPNTIRLEQK